MQIQDVQAKSWQCRMCFKHLEGQSTPNEKSGDRHLLFCLFQRDMDLKFERWLNLDKGDHVMEVEEVVRRLMEGKGSPSPPGLNSASQQHRV